MPAITEAEVMAVIAGIERGEVAVRASDEKTPRLDAYCPSSVESARRWGMSEAGASILIRNS